MAPSFAKLLNGLSNAVKGDTNSDSSSSNSHNHSTITDKYHTSKLNKPNPNSPIRLSIKIESPPILMYGPPEESSGALFSGMLVLEILPKNGINSNNNTPGSTSGTSTPQLTPLESSSNNNSLLTPSVSLTTLTPQQLKSDYVEIREVSIALIQIVDYGKPFLPNSNTLQQCSDCRRKTTELARWDVLTKPSAFAKASTHGFPFSHLIPGSIPSTSTLSNSNTSIKYELICNARYVISSDNNSNSIRTTSSKPKEDLINMALPVMVRRSILRGQDRNSLRVFPPTEVTATAVIPNVAYPKSSFPVEIRMDNVSSPSRRWRMRKLNWRLEESVRVRSHHCNSHASKFEDIVEYTKNTTKNRKQYKNSGGVGSPMINHFFEPPARRQPNSAVRAVNEQEEHQHQQQQQQHQQQQEQAPPDISPFASNWSIPANGGEPLQPRDSNTLMSSTMTTDLLTRVDQLDLLNETPLPKDSELYIEEIRTVTSGELKSGWKSDFSSKGRIEIVAEISILNLISMGMNATMSNLSLINSQNCDSPIFDLNYFQNGSNCSCDIEDHELGIFVSHNLIVEVIVAEEMMHSINQPLNRPNPRSQITHPLVPQTSQASQVSANASDALNTEPLPSSSDDLQQQSNSSSHVPAGYNDGGTGPDHVTGNKNDPSNHLTGIPTGVARVLRMQFKLILTERSGLGVAWDDEVPPTYHAVGALSPPTYIDATSPQLDGVGNGDGMMTPMGSRLVVPLDVPAIGSEADEVVMKGPRVPSAAKVHNR
ncbi:hypothetical protein CANARDRAFT_9383 [[Candida] arabinofermentans NRRL YB-2248]|uniref:LDB19 N-terminal domain-containing protein n=1 Tax=[Candida] arabinofermentans NRRL YB-2248 TaxID=983967 RepID=A0A1E4SVN4_9ASCO|nr:hypothetical protein CANARDRAFT_9383 [[Candida] arabinofermentans NRRL YB-2248]